MLKLFEACNIESIKNAVATLKEMGVLQQKSVFLLLSDKFRNDDQLLTALLEQVNTFRCQTSLQESLGSSGQPAIAQSPGVTTSSLRRSLMVEFPFMAKL